MLSTYSREDGQQSFSYYKRRKINYVAAENDDYIYPENIGINSLDIADGLKELLIEYAFTLEELITISTSDLAEFLGIDLYVAEIICDTARNLSSSDRGNLEERIIK